MWSTLQSSARDLKKRLQKQDFPMPTAPLSFSVPERPTTATLNHLEESPFLAILNVSLGFATVFHFTIAPHLDDFSYSHTCSTVTNTFTLIYFFILQCIGPTKSCSACRWEPHMPNFQYSQHWLSIFQLNTNYKFDIISGCNKEVTYSLCSSRAGILFEIIIYDTYCINNSLQTTQLHLH